LSTVEYTEDASTFHPLPDLPVKVSVQGIALLDGGDMFVAGRVLKNRLKKIFSQIKSLTQKVIFSQIKIAKKENDKSNQNRFVP
jgi:hypothetical protein